MRNNVHRAETVSRSSEPGAAYLYDAARRGDATDADIVFIHPEVPSDDRDVEHYGAQVLGLGDKIVIGAMWGNHYTAQGAIDVLNTGAVYILERTNPEAALPPVIQDPFPIFQNQFGGNSVQSIAKVPRADGTGFDLLISAHLHDYGTATNAGRVYLFDGHRRELLLAINNPTPQTNETFGNAVAAMGTNLVIGSPGDFYPGSSFRSGAVYVFDGTLRGETSTPILTLVKQYPNLAAGAGDRFGAGLAILGDDILVGAPNDSDPDGPGGLPAATSAGAVFVFDGRARNNPGDPRQTPLAILGNPDADDLPSPAQPKSNDSFGASLSPLGGRFAVGAPADDHRNPDGTVDSGSGAVYIHDWDSVPPDLDIGPTEVRVEAGSSFTDPGATAKDERPLKDKRPAELRGPIDLTGSIVVSGSVDTGALGTYTLTYSVTDRFGNASTRTRTVRVVDTTPPQVTCPSDVTSEATSAAGAVVSYPAPTATDTVTAMPRLTSSAFPGTLFPLGTTTVFATATDGSGNSATCSFSVRVRDTTPPQVMCPTDLAVETASSAGVAVRYPAPTATDAVTATPRLSATAPSGSVFPLGSTTVVVTATDQAGNSRTCSFKVTVGLRAAMRGGGCAVPGPGGSLAWVLVALVLLAFRRSKRRRVPSL
jgi:MYXO-CTERM domain-containing protein